MKLVTGAGGFIGRHVARAANEPFRALLRRPDPDFKRQFPLAEVVSGDLLDPGVLERAVRGVDGVLHLASKNVDLDGSGFERTNVAGLSRLLEVSGHGLPIVALSSTGVYGHGCHAGSDESAPVAPDTPLSRSRAEADRRLFSAHRAGRVRATVLRPRFVYGAGDAHVIPGLYRGAQKSPVWVGGGEAKLSLVWAPDLARLAWLLVNQPEPLPADPVYHVTDGSPVSFRAVVTTTMRRFGGDLPRYSVPFGWAHAALRLRERLLRLDPETAPGITSIRVALTGQDNWFSTERLRARLPDFEFTPLERGLHLSHDWYEATL